MTRTAHVAAFALGFVAISCGAHGADATMGIVYGFRRLALSGAFLPPNVLYPTSPLEPGAQSKEPPARPMPEPGPDDGRLTIRRADRLIRERNIVIARGNVELSFRGYEITCDQCDGDLDTEVFVMEGHATANGKYESVKGDAIQMNFRNRTYRFLDGSAVAHPGPNTGVAKGDLFLKGVSGYGDRIRMTGEECEFTTCNRGHPHFFVHARKVDVRPGKIAILEDIEIRILDKRIFSLPYMAVPLNDLSDRYLPEVGQSKDEGYFVKTRIGTPLPGESVFDTRLDYMTKLGNGLGGDYRYRNQLMTGRWQLYGISGGPRSVNGSMTHQQKLGSSAISLSGSFQRNNYLTAPASTSTNVSAQWNVPQRNGSTRLSLFRTTSGTTSFNSENTNISLFDDRRFGGGLTTSLSIANPTNKTRSVSGGIEREQIDVNFTARQVLGFADAKLDYQRSIPVGTVSNFFSSADRTPMFTLSSTARRLIGEGFHRAVPFDVEMSFGELADASTKSHISRGTFDFSFRKSHTIANRPRVSYQGRFRQSVYSDDTAQYALALNSDFSYPLGRDTAFTIRYNHLRPYGFTPLAIDRQGVTNVVGSGLSFRPFRSLLVGAETAYDLVQLDRRNTPWQTLQIRSEWMPSDQFRMRGTANYDTFRRSWGNVRLDLDAKIGETYISAGARYDAQRKVWGAANLYVDAIRMGRLRMSFILSYNGYLKKFEAQRYAFIYDLHCAEAILQIQDNPLGFRSGREVNFFIRLKALPWNTNFGVGRRGQGLGTGTGLGF